MKEEFKEITYQEEDISFLGMAIEQLETREIFMSNLDTQRKYAKKKEMIKFIQRQEMHNYSQM